MVIDLRSDTVTLPSPTMREAMYRAEVGDDVYGEDPTINRLQELTAETMGKEAALFMPTGTMANLAALLSHAGRGEAIIVGHLSHIYQYEAGGPSTLGGMPLSPIPNEADGSLNLPALHTALRDDSDEHCAITRVLCVENTHNLCGGTVLTPNQLKELATIAHQNKMLIHMDGARLFNAATSLEIQVRELAQPVDSLMFCLSKGLAAPAGSMLVGSRDFIRRAHRNRKLLGGGMRQAGILAAAGLVALREMPKRLHEDHQNARRLAEGLATMPQIRIEPEHMRTNILIFSPLDTQKQSLPPVKMAHFIAQSGEQGVLLSDFGGGRVRAVTHYGIESRGIDLALKGIQHALQNL